MDNGHIEIEKRDKGILGLDTKIHMYLTNIT